MEELYQVISAKPMDGFKVFVTFENGVSGIFDCEYLTADPYWAKLKSPALFRQVRAECGTLCWPEDIDIAPESVWEDVSKGNVQNNGSLWLNFESTGLFASESGAEYDPRPPSPSPVP